MTIRFVSAVLACAFGLTACGSSGGNIAQDSASSTTTSSSDSSRSSTTTTTSSTTSTQKSGTSTSNSDVCGAYQRFVGANVILSLSTLGSSGSPLNEGVAALALATAPAIEASMTTMTSAFEGDARKDFEAVRELYNDGTKILTDAGASPSLIERLQNLDFAKLSADETMRSKTPPDVTEVQSLMTPDIVSKTSTWYSSVRTSLDQLKSASTSGVDEQFNKLETDCRSAGLGGATAVTSKQLCSLLSTKDAQRLIPDSTTPTEAEESTTLTCTWSGSSSAVRPPQLVIGVMADSLGAIKKEAFPGAVAAPTVSPGAFLTDGFNDGSGGSTRGRSLYIPGATSVGWISTQDTSATDSDLVALGEKLNKFVK